MTTAPEIPSSPNGQIYSCFYKCTSLAGNVVSYTHPVSDGGWGAVFGGTVDDIYVIDMTGTTTGKDAWVSEASHYSNVHYEADDNPVPALTMSLTRVGAMNSTTPVENGEYAYVKATAILYGTKLPYGWAVNFGTEILKLDGTTQSPQWTETHDGNTYTLECWRPLGDTAKHTLTMQVSDSITDSNDTVMASHDSQLVTQILPKAYKLVDYYHDDVTDTEGVAFGKFADEANMFDVDMPARFRDAFVVDRLVGEIKAYAGATVPTGWLECNGSEVAVDDYPLLYNAIGDTWGTPSDSDHFVLPNLNGRVPVGVDANDTAFASVGIHSTNDAGYIGEKTHTLQQGECAMPNHNHPTASSTYFLYSNANIAVNGTNRSFPATGSSNHFVYSSSASAEITEATTTGNRSANASSAHNNVQPYAVVNYIICAV